MPRRTAVGAPATAPGTRSGGGTGGPDGSVGEPTRSVAVDRPALAAGLVARLGGRFSAEVGIDVDGGEREVDRWFLAATLFGTRISAAVASATYRMMDGAGVATLDEVAKCTWDELVALLDAGGYARYDFRMATRLHQLAAAVGERYGGRVAALAELRDHRQLEAELDRLPGWGPVTVRLFLRELRGVWPGADPPLEDRVAWAAAHAGLVEEEGSASSASLGAVAAAAGIDERDLEAGLLRLALGHARLRSCPGGSECRLLAR